MLATNRHTRAVYLIAEEVSDFMHSLYEVDQERFERILNTTVPFGHLDYAEALSNWYKSNRPIGAYFHYSNGKKECPMLMAFRKEISACFELPILTETEHFIRQEPKVNTVIVGGIN